MKWLDRVSGSFSEEESKISHRYQGLEEWPLSTLYFIIVFSIEQNSSWEVTIHLEFCISGTLFGDGHVTYAFQRKGCNSNVCFSAVKSLGFRSAWQGLPLLLLALFHLKTFNNKALRDDGFIKWRRLGHSKITWNRAIPWRWIISQSCYMNIKQISMASRLNIFESFCYSLGNCF